MRVAILLLLAICSLLAAGLAGTYKGSYNGSAGASGDFVVALTKAENGDWKSEVSFSLGGETVKTKVTALEVNGAKVKIVYTFDLQGTVLESTVNGELKESTLEGTYHTKAAADGSAVDDGTWKATQSR